MTTHDCVTAEKLLPELWSGEIARPERGAERAWLDTHLAACAACTADAEVWRRLGELTPAPAPSVAMRHRFDAMLTAYEHGLAQAPPAAPARRGNILAWALPRPALALAATLLLAAGLGAGWWMRGAAQHTSGATQESSEIAELRNEVQSTRQLAVMSLLQQQSANDRLQGVAYAAPLAPADTQVTAALLHSLKYDASPDVRLAALDALQPHAAVPTIQQGLVAAFHDQTSPLLQIALVDSFVESRDRATRPLLQQISKDAAYSPEVRQRAAWGLAQPTWN